LDTLSANHIGLYGYPRPVSPWLDGFAKRSWVFEHAVSSSSWTLPAHATLFTGLFPRAHGADLSENPGAAKPQELDRLGSFSQAQPLSQEASTLAEIAKQAGLDTGAICANSGYLHGFFGLNQGFDTYVDILPNRKEAEPTGIWFISRLYRPVRWRANANSQAFLIPTEVNSLALRWVNNVRERRFFLFLKYMDTHDPYLPLGKYRDLFPAAWPPRVIDQAAILGRDRKILFEEREALVDA
jgi:arylsulfatase A-like enzyme